MLSQARRFVVLTGLALSALSATVGKTVKANWLAEDGYDAFNRGVRQTTPHVVRVV